MTFQITSLVFCCLLEMLVKASPCYTSHVTSRMEDEAPDEFSPEEICNSCGALEGTVCVRGRAESRVKQVGHLSQVQY